MKKSVLWLAAALLLASGVLGIDLDYNETFVFTYTNASNETANETFTCPPEKTDSSVCVVDVTLDPDEDVYRTTEGSCDIRVRVDRDFENDVCEEFDHGAVRHTERIQITQQTDGDIIIETSEKRYLWDADQDIANIEYSLQYSCPETERVVEEQDQDQLFALCGQFAPVLANDWLAPTLESCRMEADNYANLIEERRVDTKEYEQEIGELRAENTRLTTALNNSDTLRQNLAVEKTELETKTDQQKGTITFLAVMCIFTMLGLGYTVMNQ